jgi:membrane protein DedA with SNARE-associated domain
MHELPDFLTHYGYIGLFGFLVLGIVGLPVPDETILVVAGYLISRGRLNPWLTFLAAFAGSICGITASYVIGRTLGFRVVTRYGKWLHVTEERVHRVNHWFHRLGHWLLAGGYFIPGVRHFTALVAGMSDLEFPGFALFAYPGGAIWVASFLCLGYYVGEKWESALHAVDHYLWVICVAIGVLGGMVWWWRRHRRNAGR